MSKEKHNGFNNHVEFYCTWDFTTYDLFFIVIFAKVKYITVYLCCQAEKHTCIGKTEEKLKYLQIRKDCLFYSKQI